MPIVTFTIGDVANWKHHQRLDEILFFFFLPALHQRNQQSCFKNTLSCNIPTKLNAIQFVQQTLAVMRAFHTA